MYKYVVAIFICVACSKPIVKQTQTYESSGKEIPYWVLKGTGLTIGDGDRFFCGVGSAPKTSKLNLQRERAKKRAVSELKKVLYVFASFMMQVYYYNGDETPVDVLPITECVLNTGAETLAIYTDPTDGYVYTLVALNIKNILRVERCNSLDQRVIEYVKENAVRVFDSLMAENRDFFVSY